jgi:hypothetical protein
MKHGYKFNPETGERIPLTPEESAASDKDFSERFTEDCTLKATLHLRKPSTAQKSPGRVSSTSHSSPTHDEKNQ